MKNISAIFFVIAGFSILCFGAPQPSSADTLSPAKFTAEYTKLLKQKKPAIVPEVIGDLHVRTSIDGKTYDMFLDIAYKEYLSAVTELDRILGEKAKNAIALCAAGITVDINRIVPTLKSRRFLKDSADSAAGSKPDTDNHKLVYDGYNEQLVIVYGQDLKTHIAYFNAAELKKAGIDRGDLLEIAVNNLTHMLPGIKTLEDNGVFMINAGGCYESSLLLYRKFWSKTQFPVNGDLIIAVPSQDIVLVAGRNDKRGIDKIHTLAKKLHKESRCPLAADLFVLDSAGIFKIYDQVAENRIMKKTGSKTSLRAVSR